MFGRLRMCVCRSPVTAGCLIGLLLVVPLFYGSGCEAFNFPTVEDVNTLAEADHEFIAEEHKAIRNQMTDEHVVQTPALQSDLVAINANYMAVVKTLRERVDAVEAQGVSIGSFGGANDWITALAGMLGLGGAWGWISNLFKPSRATGAIADLEKSTTARIAQLEKALATAAGAGKEVPSDS